MIGIYKITSPSGKHYIGQSVDVECRWKHYQNLCKRHRQEALFCSFQKHGVESHHFEILETLNQELPNNELIEWLDKKELDYSIQFNSLVPNGLNLRIGKGRGHLSKEVNEKNRISHLGPKNHMYGKKTSEKTKQKIRIKLQGEKSPHFGKKHSIERRQKVSNFRKTFKVSKETCLKISKANSGSNNWMFGRHHSETTKEKIRIKKTGIPAPEGTGAKISAKLKGRIIPESVRINMRGKPRLATLSSVDQFSLNGEFIKTYPSISMASRELGCSINSISHTCTNVQKTGSGYIWKYHNETQKQTA